MSACTAAGRRLAVQALAAHERMSCVASCSGRSSGADAAHARRSGWHAVSTRRASHVARARRSSALRELAEQKQERQEAVVEAQVETGAGLLWLLVRRVSVHGLRLACKHFAVWSWRPGWCSVLGVAVLCVTLCLLWLVSVLLVCCALGSLLGFYV